MRKVKVALRDCSYEIHIGAGLLGQAGNMLQESQLQHRAIIITNPVVRGLYGGLVEGVLNATGFTVNVLEVADGEEHKSLEIAGQLYTTLAGLYTERTTPIFALGGGVIGDLAGFVAATYMRGLPLVHLPTTLLAQVDSSIGGKTAVNHGRLKNMVGAFYQPSLVISDTATLQTLPDKEFTNGLAEVIKSAVIGSGQFFAFIEANLEKIRARDNKMLDEVVFRCASIKADVVSKDELDSDYRNILNFGHTIGHGIETASNFNVGHGAAIAIGMLTAAAISNRLGILEEKDMERLKDVIEGTGLPTEVAGCKVAEIIEAIKHDKKVVNGKAKFILPRKMGEVLISEDVDISLVEKILGGQS
jgi:3-dehydroquinate synthase